MPETKLVVLDFTNVEYIDSAGLGTIVRFYLSSKGTGCQLKLINLSRRVRELFSMAQLTDILENVFGVTPE